MSIPKVPVFATFTQVLGLSVGRFFTVLRLSWFPLAAYAVVSTLLSAWSLFGEDLAGLDRPWAEQFAARWILIDLPMLVALAAAAVALHRLILFGEANQGALFAFAFGRVEARYFQMLLVGALTLPVIEVVYWCVATYVLGSGERPLSAVAADLFARGPYAVATTTLGLSMTGYGNMDFGRRAITFLLLTYLSLWPVTIVAEGRAGPFRAMSLIRGNYVRVLGVFLLLHVFALVAWLGVSIPVLAIWGPQVLAKIVFAGTEAWDFHRGGLWKPAVGAAQTFLVILGGTTLSVSAVSYCYKAMRSVGPDHSSAIR